MASNTNWLFFVTLVFINFVACSNASSFIMFSALSSQSHLNVFYGVGEGLAVKGHQVTIVSAMPPKNITGITEIFLPTFYEKFINNPDSKGQLLNEIDPDKKSDSHNAWASLLFDIPKLCPLILDDEPMKEIAKSSKRYDIAINNMYANDCTLPIASKLAKYVVLLSAGPMMNNIAYDLNVPHPLAYIPSMALSYPTPMTFCQRAINAGFGIGWWALNNLVGYKTLNAITKERFPELPTAQDVRRNASLVLINTIPAIDGAIPSVPYVKDIGGIGIKPNKPLPKEFETFIKGAGEAGFIFVSLGSIVPEELLPEPKKKDLISAFSKLPYRVIWKFKEQRSDLPANVLTTKWAPQQDILAHPQCRAFISHGGGASLLEARYHAVPVLGMPVFGDQPSNVQKAVESGYGLALDWSDLTVDLLIQRLQEVIKNPKYKEKALYFSELIRDQPETPLDRAVFWLEYVIRHNGAAHLRTAADHLNFVQYFLLDVIAAALLLTAVILYVVYKVVRLVVSVVCGRAPKKDKVKKH